MAKLEALKLGATAGKDFTFTHHEDKGPREVTVHIRPLTALDLDRARVSAETYVADLVRRNEAAGQSREALIDDAREIEVLALALRDPDKPDECWAGSALLRSMLTTNEIALLFRAYHEHQDHVGPLFSTLTFERYEEMIKAIAQVGRADPLVISFDSHTQRAFITTMAVELWSSRTAKSSGTSDSNERESKSLNSDGDEGSPSAPPGAPSAIA